MRCHGDAAMIGYGINTIFSSFKLAAEDIAVLRVEVCQRLAYAKLRLLWHNLSFHKQALGNEIGGQAK
jgi:hypothetical protein